MLLFVAMIGASAMPPVASASMFLTMNEVEHQLNLSASKRANIVLSGLKPSHIDDALVVSNLLCEELCMNASR